MERHSKDTRWDSHFRGDNEPDNYSSWPYPYLEGYLKGLRHGELALHKISEMPDILEIGLNWHYLLNAMRSQTSEKHLEHHTFIALDYIPQLILPSDFSVGEKLRIPGHVIQKSRSLLTQKGTDKFLGDIHTHPRDSSMSILNRIQSSIVLTGTFSAGDLYFTIKKSPHLIMGVTTEENNVFAFRTRESRTKDSLNYLKKAVSAGTEQNTFETFWFNRRGLGIDCSKRTCWKISGRGGVSINDLWQINLDIASWHNLALYRGWKDDPVFRQYPHSMINRYV